MSFEARSTLSAMLSTYIEGWAIITVASPRSTTDSSSSPPVAPTLRRMARKPT